MANNGKAKMTNLYIHTARANLQSDANISSGLNVTFGNGSKVEKGGVETALMCTPRFADADNCTKLNKLNYKEIKRVFSVPRSKKPTMGQPRLHPEFQKCYSQLPWNFSNDKRQPQGMGKGKDLGTLKSIYNVKNNIRNISSVGGVPQGTVGTKASGRKDNTPSR